jgi:phosphoribosylaminoimidazole (AIR) synthetase
MGIGMIIIVSNDEAAKIRELINVSEIGKVEEGKGGVKLI